MVMMGLSAGCSTLLAFLIISVLFSASGCDAGVPGVHGRRTRELPRRQISIPGLAEASAAAESFFAGLAAPATTTSGAGSAATTHALQVTSTASADPFASLLGQIPGINTSALTALLDGSSGFNISSLGALFKGGITSVENSLLGLLNGTGFALGVGLGEGASTGLNLTTPELARVEEAAVLKENGMNADGINGVALQFANGLAAMVVPIVMKTGMNLSMFAPYVYPIARGIGNGTIMGLDISDTVLKPSTGTNISDLVGSLGFGLSDSIAGNVNMSKVGGFDLGSLSNMRAILQGAGEGLSQGALAGLGVAKASLVTQVQADVATNGSLNIPIAVQDFMSGLSGSVLANIDFRKVQTKFGGMTNSLDVPKIIEGLARGLVDGAVSGVNASGGLSNLISGKVSPDALTTASAAAGSVDSVYGFDDSLNGSAIAFGYGLSNEAILQFGQSLGGDLSKVVNGSTRRRSLGSRVEPVAAKLEVRQSGSVNNNATAIVNSTFLTFLAQESIDALQCNGVGGIGSILVGLLGSKTVSLSSFKVSNSTTSLLPSGPISINLNGNNFQVGLKDIAAAKINGLSIVPFAVFTTLHILLSTLAFFFALPAFIILACVQRISELCNLPLSPKCRIWQSRTLYYIFAPLAIGGTVFGIIGMGNSKHFRTGHGVLGFFTLISTLPTLAFRIYYFRNLGIKQLIEPPLNYRLMWKPWKYSNREWKIVMYAVVISLANAAFPLGFTDLNSVSMCLVGAIITLPVAIGFGGGAMMAFATATGLANLVMWLEQRALKRGAIIGVVEELPPMPEKVKEYYVEDWPGTQKETKPDVDWKALPRKPVPGKDVNVQEIQHRRDSGSGEGRLSQDERGTVYGYIPYRKPV